MPEKEFPGRASARKFWTTAKRADAIKRNDIAPTGVIKDCGGTAAVAQVDIHSCLRKRKRFSIPYQELALSWNGVLKTREKSK